MRNCGTYRVKEVFVGGINVHCANFSGDDKSCSAFEGVMEAIASLADTETRIYILEILENFDEELILLEPDNNLKILPVLNTLKSNLTQELTNEIGEEVDPYKIAGHDEFARNLDSTDAKYGLCRGWQLLCTTELIKAIEVSQLTNEHVALIAG